MSLNWKVLRWSLGLLLVLFSAGCSGINSTQSVSPLDFLMPGATKFLHLRYTPPPPPTNTCVTTVWQPQSAPTQVVME